MLLLDDFAQRSATARKLGNGRPPRSPRCVACQTESRNFYDWRDYLVRYPGARSAEGNGYYNGQYDAASGFNYGQLRILHGDHYGASYTDALLHAAWVEGSLDPIPNLRPGGSRGASGT